MSISVAMATYNGEKYIKQQLDSILIQLSTDDEIVISDDGSSDKTLEIIRGYTCKYKNINLLVGSHRGVIKNFENAILHCRNDIIFISDQDNIWKKNKKKMVIDCLEKNQNAELIIHNFETFYEDESPAQVFNYHYHSGYLHNMIKSSYYGFTMAMRKNFINSILPFPQETVAYDQWIGLCSEKRRGTIYIDEPLTLLRRHRGTVSRKLSLKDKIKFRVDTIRCCMKNR